MIEEETGSNEAPETEIVETEVEAKPEKEKTVRDSIKDAIALLKNDNEEHEDNSRDKGKTTQSNEDKNQAQKTAPRAPRRKTIEIENAPGKTASVKEDIEPPAQFDIKEKEWYRRQPPETKRVMSRIVNQSVAEVTKAHQAAASERNARAEWESAVAPFKKAWGMRGLSDAQAVRQLAAVNQHLIDNGARGIADLARAMKVDPNEIIAQLTGGQNGGTQHQQQNNLPDSLTQELNESRLFRQQLIQAAQQQRQSQVYNAGQAIAAEIKSVMDEIDPAGNYKFPQLHDDSFRKSLEPLLLALRQKDPTLSWSELTKRAYSAVTGKGFEPTSYAPKVSVNPLKKLNASVSVKSRGAASPMALPKANGNESVRDSIRRAIELNRRGENY